MGVFPAVVAVALVRSLERRPSLLSLVLVMAAIKWAEMARLTRVLVLRSMAEDWALAARSMGASPLRIALRHVGPHLAAPLSIGAVLAMASVALTETSLSFLELGVPATTVSWGEMLRRNSLRRRSPRSAPSASRLGDHGRSALFGRRCHPENVRGLIGASTR